MKTKILIFLFFLLANSVYSFAQDDVYNTPSVKHKRIHNENKAEKYPWKINSGFVFIDGKYVDAPYRLKIKNKILYINNIPVTVPKPPIKNPLAGYNKHLKQPPCLNKNSTLNDIRNCREANTNLTYYDYMNFYYLKRYPYKVAIDSLVEYIRSFPNVKSFEEQSSGFWEMTLFNGEEFDFCLSGDGTKRMSELWGPGGKGKKRIKKKNALGLKSHKELFEEILTNNNALLISNNFSNRYEFDFISSAKLPDIHKIITDKQLTLNVKVDTLKKIMFLENFTYDLLINYNVSPQFLERLKKIKSKESSNKVLFKHNQDKNIRGNLQKNKKLPTKSLQDTYSPKNQNFFVWCPYSEWDEAFERFNEEYSSVKDFINFTFPNYHYFIDNTANDDDIDFGECTFQNLLNMANGGFLYVGVHGTTNGYLLIQMASDQNSLSNWCANDPDVHIAAMLISDIHNSSNAGTNGWDVNYLPFGAYVNSQFFNDNWKTNLTVTNSIVMIDACYSANNNLLESYGGAIAFGYSQETQYQSILGYGIKYNNKQLLKRMNGTYDNGNSRDAITAYLQMPRHDYGFTYNANDDLTLCPATKNYYPADEQQVGAEGDGYFEVDTWCDASVPLYPNDQDSPISFNSQTGVTITNLQWADVQNGRSKKITFHWWASQNDYVDVHINHLMFQSAPSENDEYHVLDFDKQAPNTEDGDYYFTIDTSNPIEAPVAGFTYVVNNNQVVFTDQSHNNPTSWSWDFGDGGTSIQQYPSHTYASTGSYTVSLTASNVFGSDTKTQTVYISNTPATVSISGQVTDDSYVAISGATVTAEDDNNNEIATATNASGNYSLSVPYGWTGNLTASATGYNTSIHYFSNGIINNITGEDFALYGANDFYISADPNPVQATSDIILTAHNVPIGSNLEWDFGDGSFYHPNATSVSYSYGSSGTYTVTLTATNSFTYDEMIVQYQVTVLEPPIPEVYEPNFNTFCNVVNIGTPVTFYDNSYFPHDFIVGWKWFFDWDNDPTVTSSYFHKEQEDVNPSYLNVSHTYTSIGKKLIKLQSYKECGAVIQNSWFCDVTFNNMWWDEYKSAWGGIIAVDCDRLSTPVSVPPAGTYYFIYAVLSDYAHNHWGAPYDIYGGSFEFNGVMNNFLNQAAFKISACNEITINGDVEFVANGNNELILESGEIPNCQQNKYFDLPDLSSSIKCKTDSNFSKNTIVCYPNPCTNKLFIDVNLISPQIINIVLTSILGETITTFNKGKFAKGSYRFSIETKKLTPGIYFIKTNIKGCEQVIKFVKTE